MRTNGIWPVALALALTSPSLLGLTQSVQPASGNATEISSETAHQTTIPAPLMILGPGDEVRMRVFGQPNMNGTVYVSDDGTINVPLVGEVHVGGLSPLQAAHIVQNALKNGQYLRNPQVTLTIVKSRSQQVAVLGQVRAPGLYSVDSNTTVIDLLAKAGGETKDGSNTVYILRTTPGGDVQRVAVDLRGLADPQSTPEAAIMTLHGGDRLYVPRAPVFYVTGQVHAPGSFRLDSGMTVLQAIARAGGITDIGSMKRIVIKRHKPDGQYRIISARQTDTVRRNDVIIVKERIF